MAMNEKEVEQQCREFREMFEALRGEIGKVIVGHEEIVDDVLISLFSGGHVLLEGVPGTGQDAAGADAQRGVLAGVPADPVHAGPDARRHHRHEHRRWKTRPAAGASSSSSTGRSSGRSILADEINRATPKTQSAMLEAMQEHSVTSGGQVRKLPEPFIVLATQNPIEQEGTYPLPEAQLDRFFFKLLVGYSNREELKAILDRTTTGAGAAGAARGRRREDPLGPEAGPAGRGRRARAGLRHSAGPGDASARRVRDGDDESVRPLRLLAARRAGPGPGGQGPRPARRAVPRQLRRHRAIGPAGPAAPAPAELRGPGRGHPDGRHPERHSPERPKTVEPEVKSPEVRMGSHDVPIRPSSDR